MTEPEPRKEHDKSGDIIGTGARRVHFVPHQDVTLQDWHTVNHWHVMSEWVKSAFVPRYMVQPIEQAQDAKQADELLASIDQRLTALEDDTRKLMWRYGL